MLTKDEWNNTRLVKDNREKEMQELKQMPGKDMTVLGSGSIVTRLAPAGLIDEYQFMVDPVVLDDGTPIFRGIGQKLDLKLAAIRAFKSGVVLLLYQPMQREVI
jgi:dihydrofolate reductase